MDDENIQRIAEIAGCTIEEAVFYFSASDRNVERAIEMSLDQQTRATDYTEHAPSPQTVQNQTQTDGQTQMRQRRHTNQAESSSARGAPRGNESAAASSSYPTSGARGFVPDVSQAVMSQQQLAYAQAIRRNRQQQRAQQRGQQVNGLVLFVGRVLRQVGSVISGITKFVLPNAIYQRLIGIAALFGQYIVAAQPTQSAQDFVNNYNRKYGKGITWQQTSWKDAADLARVQFKFLLVYFHAPDHEDVEDFCQGALSSQPVIEFAEEQFICWGGDITNEHTFEVCSKVAVQAFPAIVLLAHSGSTLERVACIEGYCTGEQLLHALQQVVDQNGAQLIAARADSMQHTQNRELRDQQDAEYLESLRKDQEKAKRKEQEKKEIEEKEKQQREEAAALEAQQAAELAKREHTEKQLSLRRDTKRAALPQEPDEGPSVTTLRIRLPQGSSLQRRFNFDDYLQQVVDYVDCCDDVESLQYTLIQAYPRKEYAGSDLSMTLQQLGLTPSAALYVQPMDEDN